YWIGWYGTMSADLEEALNWCDAIEGAQIALVDAQSGEITDIADAITDEDGAVTLSFDEPGEYLITAYVTAEQIADYENPLIMTLAEITVTAAANS
nr:carboxypeptidase-like regulatory domain-containing protein [Oscillospiraceae bacterium]